MRFPIKPKVLIWSLIAALVVVGLILGLYFGYKSNKEQNVSRGAVVSNVGICADIGKKVLEEEGTAVDAELSILFCEGVLQGQSMGIGGGFVATVYTRDSKRIETVIARESAPLLAYEDMYINKTITGAISVAVPGEVLGYWELHQKYGKLPWRRLIEPTIKLCRTGFPVSKHMSNALNQHEQRILNEPSMREILVNPETGRVYKEKDTIYRHKLAETLEIIADEGADAIYNGGKVGKMIVKDVQEMGGYLTEEDFKRYRVLWRKPTVAQLREGHTVYSVPLPGSGAVLSFILNLMNNLMTSDTELLYHRLVESFKHGYGQRTHLGDVEFEPHVQEVFDNLTNPAFADEIRKLIFDDKTFSDYSYYGANFSNAEDHGTANSAVLATNGDAIVVTSTVNSLFGAKVRSMSTGIIMNDEMDDFSTPGINNGFGIPPSPANFIKPMKRPMSSMCPSIILNDAGDVELLVGAAGGSKITTAVAQVILRYFMFKQSIKSAVEERRLHHQLAPMEIAYERGFNENILRRLSQIGHNVLSAPNDGGFAALTAIGAKNSYPVPVYDSRRPGGVGVIERAN